MDKNPNIAFDLVRLDIRSFKLINSVFGVEMGDQTLMQLARNMKDFFDNRPNCVYGRIQADLFAFCTPAYKKDDYQKAVNHISEVFLNFPFPFHVNLLFGIYNITDRNLDVSVMLDKANVAAEEGKQNGMPFGIYTPQMEEESKEEKLITSQMSKALDSGEFQVFYQPKYNLKTDKVGGAEALVRWFSPKLGAISPSKFIPIFEKNGFISTLDQYVWEETCKFLSSCIGKGLTPLPISINISKLDVYSIDIVKRLTTLVEKYNISPSLLGLEITESVFIDNFKYFNEIISVLREKGFLIYMDDFGSGYFSLNVLKDMEVDVLKIDMKFFSFTENKKKSNSIVESIIQLAHGIGIPVIAEGVEQKEQADFLRLVNCDYIQGFIFSKAISQEDYTNMITTPALANPLSDFNLNLIWSEDTRSIFDSSLQAFCLVRTSSEDKTIEYVYTNRAYDKIFGHSTTNTRENLRSIILPDSRKGIINAFKKCHELKNSNQCECMAIMPDGKIKWISIFARLVYQKGKWDVILCSFTDITAMKSLQSELSSKSIQKGQLHLSSLLISSNPAIMSEVSNMMISNFENCYTAKSPQDGLIKIKEIKDDLNIVIVDLSMPQDGLKKLNQAFKDDKTKSYKILTLVDNQQSGAALIENFNSSDDFIIYPFTKRMLMLRLKNILNIEFPNVEGYL